MTKRMEDILKKLVDIQFERNDINFVRGKFRVRGDVLEIFPASTSEHAIRVEFFGDEIDRICEIDVLTGEVLGTRKHVAIYPASHYVTTPEKREKAISAIELELEERIRYFKDNDMLLEAQRIEQRTQYDIEMMREIGFCQGIENYSRHISGRAPGSAPYTLLDYFPEDFLLVVDESHVTIPQVRAMYHGDRSRKESLVNYGFRLPSAFDNRPLNFKEFNSRLNQVIYVSATPADYEKERAATIAEQVIRPTGLLDPEIEIRPTRGQIDDLIDQIHQQVSQGDKTLITTLTKKTAEDLTDYLREADIKVKYLHSEIKTFERMEIVRDLRAGLFDVLVGINLLREGLDIPEVSLIAILDADKEGFLRSETSLIQTIGRAARNERGRVILYADSVTGSMERAIRETNRRRLKQMAYNDAHGIVPKTIKKGIRDVLSATDTAPDDSVRDVKINKTMDINLQIELLSEQMRLAASELRFEDAAKLRDKIRLLEAKQTDLK